MAALYHERWEIEGYFKQIKCTQLNDAKIFRSKSPDGVRQEFCAHLAVHYATMSIATDAATLANLDPGRISHKNTVRVIRSRIWMPDSFPLNDHDDHYLRLLGEVAGEVNIERRDRSLPSRDQTQDEQLPSQETPASTATSLQPTTPHSNQDHAAIRDRAPQTTSQNDLNDWHCG